MFAVEIGTWVNGDPKNVLREQYATEAAARAQLVAYADPDAFGKTADFAGYLFAPTGERLAILHMYGGGRYRLQEEEEIRAEAAARAAARAKYLAERTASVGG